MKRRILSIIMITVCIFSLCLSKVNAETIINSENSNVIFSTIPDADDLKLMDPIKSDVKSWMVDKHGHKKYVKNMNTSNISTYSFTVGRLLYTFLRYDENVTKTNDYQHFVSSVSLRNTTKDPIKLKYTQSSSKVNYWSVTGKVEAEAEFKVAMLSKLKATFGASISTSTTTTASETVEFTINVPVGKTGKISKYYAGKYSGGQGVWSVKDAIGGYDKGYYYEEAGAWAIERSEVNYKATIY